ncbi:hypothetical protein E3P77_00027 [Wallemia ichthyophaga]|nr:hypothetical protein E3P77_00027 [Wallemia ichthyophaga]
MESNYPKIDLESKEHLKFLEGYYKNELFSQVDSSQDDNDALNSLLNTYFNKTFSLIHPNIKINGQNYSDLNFDDDVEFEHFDDKLRLQMSELDSNIEQLQNRLAEKRKLVPLELEELLTRQLKRKNTSNVPDKDHQDGDDDVNVDKDQLDLKFNKDGLEDIGVNLNDLLAKLPQQISKLERTKNLKDDLNCRKPDVKKKLVVTGDGGCGKTCLLIVYAEHRFPEEYVPTVFENYVSYPTFDGKIVELALWDTAGQEEYDRLRPLSYPESDIILIVFSIDYPTSLENVKDKWFPEVSHFCSGVPRILVGTKIDLRQDPETRRMLSMQGLKPVSYEQGVAVSKEIGAAKYIECSAKKSQDKKSLFVAYLIPVSSDKDSQSSSPSHSISAYRFVGLKSKKIGLNQDDFTVKTAYDDDGEKWAGKRILEVLEQTQTLDALIVVSRWYGGIMLGPVRFQHIKDLSLEVCNEMKKNEGMRESFELLQGLDESIADVRSKLGMENKPTSYDSIDFVKSQRLIKARKGTLDILKKKLSHKVESAK